MINSSGASGQVSRPEQNTGYASKVVGIGASAGGLAALGRFLQQIPPNSGLAFVVVVHLSPEHPSSLSDLLQFHASIPVVQVTDTLELQPNHVYVIPPGRNLSTIDTHLRLSPLEADRRLRAPIDHFFGTLATTHSSSAVAVILSGTGSDGAAGIKKIKSSGGLTIVQDPNESEYDGMPQSAIATGMVDFVLPVEEISTAVLRLASTTPRLLIPDGDQDEMSEVDRTAMQLLFSQLRTRTGQDFSRYKESTVLRRIRRRMQIRQVEELTDYLSVLQDSAEESQALLDDLLITVTNFFRDPETFERLKTDIVPRLFADKGPNDRVRVWSVGCATGEEAYSLAMLLLEFVDGKKDMPELQVFASDLHQPSLLRAREGFYSEHIETDVSAERLTRFFSKVPGGYQVRKEVRGMIVFASHNILRDPTFSQIDLLSCRNLLIYLKRSVQEDVIQIFHYALSPGKYLLLGSSETVQRSDLFRLTDKKHCLYASLDRQAAGSRMPVFPLQTPRLNYGSAISAHSGLPAGVLHQRAVERFAAPSILLNRDYNIVHLSEHAGLYLIQPGGEPTNNVIRRIRPDLQMELARLLPEAKEKKLPVRSRPVRLIVEGAERIVTMRASAANGSDLDGLILVIFDDAAVSIQAEPNAGEQAASVHQEVREELELNKHRLQSLIAEYESSQEDMQASNEELQSTNEELRSTMEELETSKEELQSMNEELQTVNQESKHKVEELSQLSADLQNLLAATDIATLFLDRSLRILRFTPRVSEVFNIRNVDRGRPLADLTHRLGNQDLLNDAKSVLAKLVPIEREVRSEEGLWYLTRMLPYRGAEDRIEGVVLTFVDISQLKTAEQATEDSDERYRLLVENVLEYAIFTLDPEGCISTWNAGAQRLFGYSDRDMTGSPFTMLFTPEDRANEVPSREMANALLTGQSSHDRVYLRHDGSTFWASGVLTALRTANGELRGFATVMRDNTERRTAQEELETRNAELLRINRELEEFAYVASHDLQEPLRMVSIYSQLLLQLVDVDKSEKAKRFAEFISSGALRMEGLINDLLGYSKVLHEETEPIRETDCNQALKEALEVLAERIKETNGTISSDALPTVFGKHRNISVIFQNLLSNALKYHKTGEPPRIHISANRTAGEWTITVSDHGIGFSPEYSERIFGLFKRLHKQSFPGTGLGLAICKQLAERNNGKIRAESNGEGLGARFHLTLRAAGGDTESSVENLPAK